MIDFLRLITGYLYVFIPVIIVLFVVYKIVVRNLPEYKQTVKTVYRYVMLFVCALFALAVIRMAVINEVPENSLDKSVKSERSNYSVEQAKKDTTSIN